MWQIHTCQDYATIAKHGSMGSTTTLYNSILAVSRFRYSLDIFWPFSIHLFSWALQGPCCVHPRHPVLHFEWDNVPGHVVTNDETSSPPLCWSCSLIPNMHLPNYYETGWINLLDVESSPSKYWPVSIYQVGVTSVCYIYKKNSYLDDSTQELLMILHTNLEMFDNSAHEYCINPRRLSVLTEYLSLSLTHFTPTNLANHFI